MSKGLKSGQGLFIWSFKDIVREYSKFADWDEGLNDSSSFVRTNGDIVISWLVAGSLSGLDAIIE